MYQNLSTEQCPRVTPVIIFSMDNETLIDLLNENYLDYKPIFTIPCSHQGIVANEAGGTIKFLSFSISEKSD